MKCSWWLSNNFFDLKEIKQLNSFVEKNKDLSIYDLHKQQSLKTSIVYHVQWSKIKILLEKFNTYIDFVNQEGFGFHLHPMNDLNYISHNKYEDKNKGKYEYHMDGFISDKSSCVKLTCLINTSEKNYEGGDFFIFENGETLIKKFNEPGSILIFPSFLSHKVSEVKKGTRTTISLWRRGNHFC